MMPVSPSSGNSRLRAEARLRLRRIKKKASARKAKTTMLPITVPTIALVPSLFDCRAAGTGVTVAELSAELGPFAVGVDVILSALDDVADESGVLDVEERVVSA